MTEDLGDIRNFRQASAGLATSGQPTVGEFADIANAGYRVVINLALHDDPRYSLPDEPGTVSAAGMDYVHIPVQFDRPTKEDLLAFFDAMERHRGKMIWAHCAANMRVSAFVGLYRVLRQGWNEERAFELMKGIWKPNPVWAAFIAQMLAGEKAPPS